MSLRRIKNDEKREELAIREKRFRILPQLFAAIIAGAFVFILGEVIAWAGPPFLTDDPEPVEYRHWEVYFGSQYVHDDEGVTGTAPLIEVNYGALPDIHLHIIVPFAYSSPHKGSKQYWLGDAEFGVKYRFIHEGRIIPQVGTFPILVSSTGSESRGLGEGHIRVFIPIWLQKSWGPWTTYGGGGYWHNPGDDNKNYWQTGWEVQRKMSEALTIGAEIFNISPAAKGESDRTGFNIGTIINFSEEHHFLFSAGRDIHGPNNLTAYIAYQWTFGPRNTKEREAKLRSEQIFQ
jgi:hypothetical protein